MRFGQRVDERRSPTRSAPRTNRVSVTQRLHRYYGMSSRAEAAGPALRDQPAQSRDPYSLDATSRLQGVSRESAPEPQRQDKKRRGPSTPPCDSQASHTAALRMTAGKVALGHGRVARSFPCSRTISPQIKYEGAPPFAVWAKVGGRRSQYPIGLAGSRCFRDSGIAARPPAGAPVALIIWRHP